jgi:hypothetical protein
MPKTNTRALKIEAYQWVWYGAFIGLASIKNQKMLIPVATYQKQKSVNILWQYRNIQKYINRNIEVQVEF